MDTAVQMRRLLPQLKERPGLRRYLSNTSWLLAERVLRLGLNLFIGVYVARYLGPERFGELSYTQSFVALFAAVAMLGLDGIVVRELVNHPERRGELLGTAFGLKSAAAAITIALLAVATLLTGVTEIERLMILIIGAGILFQATNVVDFHFQATVQSRYVVYAQTAQLLLSSAIKLCLVWFDASLIWFAVATTIDAATLALGLLVVYRYARHSHSPINPATASPRRWQFRLKTARLLLSQSWPLLLSGVAVSIYMKIDQVMIREMLDAHAVGQYAAAVRISEVWYFVPLAISQSVFPAILSARAEDNTLYRQRLMSLYLLMARLSVAVALPLTFLASWTITSLYGPAFAEGGTVLAIHIWAGIFVSLGLCASLFLIAEGLSTTSLINTVVGATANIIMNLALIPQIGITGAAISTVISYAVSAYLMMGARRVTRSEFLQMTKSFAVLCRIRI